MAGGKKRGTVGIVGLGIMGGAFAKNLAKAGWHVVGFDPSSKATAAAKRAGVQIAGSTTEVAERAPVILTSLPKPSALIATAQEIAKAGLPRKTIVEMSTLEIEDKESAAKILAKAGHEMLDVPVSGTGSQAKTGDLVFYASGNAATIKKLRPMFQAFGRQVYDVGAFGNGCRMKYVANLLVAINNVASAEAMVLGMKSGLKPQMIFDLIRAGAGNSRVFELRAPMMVTGRYDDATMKIDVWQKDMQVIGDFAKKIGVKVPLFRASEPIYDKALRSGLGKKDTAAVAVVLEKMANYKRRKR
ncbi:MAG: NAD(P)-dependent oxidoreductase [Pseudolabrys sp.]|nr:NAD(P)-dependent oxidoreductase [Pseudolabrys sp.]